MLNYSRFPEIEFSIYLSETLESSSRSLDPSMDLILVIVLEPKIFPSSFIVLLSSLKSLGSQIYTWSFSSKRSEIRELCRCLVLFKFLKWLYFFRILKKNVIILLFIWISQIVVKYNSQNKNSDLFFNQLILLFNKPLFFDLLRLSYLSLKL